MRSPWSRLAGLALVWAILCAPGAAAAAEDELVLSVSPVYAVVDWDTRHPSGGGLVLDAAWGLNDILSLRATGFYTAHPASGDEANQVPSGVISVGGAFVGVSYVVDVLRVIPFIDAGLGALFAGGAGEERRVDFGFEIGIGADYLYSRRLSFGVGVRYYAFLTSITRIPVYLYAGPRLALRWD